MIIGFNSSNKERIEVIKASDIKIFSKNITISGGMPYVTTNIQLPYGWNGSNTMIIGASFRLPKLHSSDPYPWTTEQNQEFAVEVNSTQYIYTLLRNLIIHDGPVEADSEGTGYIECNIQINGIVYGATGFDSILKVAVMHIESE